VKRREYTILVGGESIEKSDWLMLQQEDAIRAFNVYGPTECTVDASIGKLTKFDPTPHIGRPIANTQIYILDQHLQPVPLGVTGEIYIGGAGVARGYLNRPELTAERFIADPFSHKAGARLYKTGDLGRYLADGNIEYLGRNDFQVKIRGFRIELGEIEAKLAACSGVREAVVIAREDQPGDKRLVAYLLAEEGVTLVAGELRAELATSLAEYMLPAAFVNLECFPLTPNGKLDRRALPAPDQASLVTRGYEAPIGEVEQTLAMIWQDLLGIDRVGRHDHFFELGGHSLLVITLMERLRQHNLQMEVRTVFSAPSLQAMAAEIATHLPL
jgi:non-ribosomal peptide synthetase component F